MPRSRRRTLLLSLVIVIGTVGVALWLLRMSAQAQESLPSPAQFFGHPMGADRMLVDWDGLHRYYQRLAISDRLALVELGPSSEGRPYVALFISSPTNLARLDDLRAINAKLADPRGLAEADINRLIADGRAVVIQSFALHSSEVAASQAAAEFVYHSITRDDEEAVRMRDEVISIVMPSINPDGTQMIAEWYMQYVGTEFEAASLPWLYQTYAGHDNNRDGFALNLVESQHLARLMYREWIPQAYVDHHQMGPFNARLSIPPYAEPIRPDADPLVWREMAWWGGHMGTQLEAAGKTGVVGAAIYSGWGHMGFHWITPFHNIAGMLTESASARLATPMFLHPDQLRGGPRALPEYAPQTTMPSVWPGGWWRVRDIVEQQVIAAWATVDLAARNRTTVLRNMVLKAQRQTERGAQGEVKAYVLPAGQHDPLTVKKLVNMLMDSGVEVHEARAPFMIADRVFATGSYVVPMAQPKQGLVRWMLGRTFYPDNTFTRDRDGTPIRPYDMSTDTFAEFMGVRAEPVGAMPPGPTSRLDGKVSLTGRAVEAAPHGYHLDGRLNDSHRAVHLLLASGASVRRVHEAPAGGLVREGDFLVAGGTDATAIAERTGVDFVALPEPVSAGTYALRAPRIGLFQRYRGGNMDEGWTRLLFERFDIPYTTLRDEAIRKGELAETFDVIVLPADSVSAMTGETPSTGPGGARLPEPNIPPEYRSAFGDEGVKALEAFVQNGGTLVAFAQAADLPVLKFGLPVRNVVAGLDANTFWAPGSTLHVRYAHTHPLVAGMPARGLALFMSGSQVYEVTSTDRSQDVEVLATYLDRDILQSGWLLGEQVIARKAAAVSVAHGKGRVVLLGFRAQNRAQTHGTFKLVFNALLAPPPPSTD
jgi:hypothetical protein